MKWLFRAERSPAWPILNVIKSRAALARQMMAQQTQAHYLGGEVMAAMPNFSS